MPMVSRLESCLKEQDRVLTRVKSIDMLSDDVLLAVFDFCASENSLLFAKRHEIEAWHSLVHVCQRWRSIVFASPRRLNLQLFCTEGTPKDALDAWPAFPLLISSSLCTGGLDNLIALLELSDRVCQIRFRSRLFDVKTLLKAMQKPFPELTNLVLWSHYQLPLLPDSFLGGSAPRLRHLWLDGIQLRGLPELLLSTTHLFSLSLENIPQSWYILPEAMVTVLSTLTSLGLLCLRFDSPRSRPDQASRHPPSLTRSSLPVLEILEFKGTSEYFEDLVARIDVPQLSTLDITFSDQIISDTPQLAEFIYRTPKLKVFKNVSFVSNFNAAGVTLSSGWPVSTVKISFEGSDRQLSSLAQIITSSLLSLSTLEDFYIYNIYVGQYPHMYRQNNINIMAWLELLHPFTGVKNLYLSNQSIPHIAPVLQELVDGRSTEVFPALQNIFLEELLSSGSVHEGIEQFVAARQVTSQPINIACWERRK